MSFLCCYNLYRLIYFLGSDEQSNKTAEEQRGIKSIFSGFSHMGLDLGSSSASTSK